MILTQCAVCATDLGLTRGKKCGRCSTRYCGAECQVQHWKEGGHDQLCKKIKRAGGAEQYNANKKYAEAVTIAAEKCADDTKGQTCYICMEVVHSSTGEGLVRGCACGDRDGVASGRAGIAHVSCLADQAKILVAEGLENNLDLESRWERWYSCGLCKQQYYGVVRCALSWACWKTYVGRPETDQARRSAMTQLSNGLSAVKHHEGALSVIEAQLSMMRRVGADEEAMLITQGNLANTYDDLGRLDQGLSMRQEVYSGHLNLNGEEHPDTLREAGNYAMSLIDLGRFGEAKALLRKVIPVTRRVLGENHEFTLGMRRIYATALYKDDGATLDDLREAEATLEETERTARRVLGAAHPVTGGIEESLREARAALSARDVTSISDAVGAL